MIHWGIIGAGNIAARFSTGLSCDSSACLYAISGRNEEKLKAFREKFPCEKIYIGHDALLDDPTVDAVYVALPHVMHKEWVIKALRAGKAVLCEKPAVLNEEEMKEIAEVSRETGILFMEAMKSRFEPAYLKLKELLEGKKVTYTEASVTFNFPLEYFGKTYHTVNPGGGCLLDSGIYCASVIADFMEGKPEVIRTWANQYQGIDIYVKSELKFDNGTAVLETAMDRAVPKKAVIKTESMTIEIDDPHRPSVFRIIDANGTEEIKVPYEHDDFYPEIHHFNQLLEKGIKESPVMSLDDSIRCAMILDTIRKGFTEYSEEDAQVIEQQEQLLRYSSFGAKDALRLGNRIVQLAQEYDRGVSVMISRVSDDMTLFAWADDSKAKRNEMYISMKKQSVLDSGHASIWPYLRYKADGSYEEWLRDGVHGISGGGFPIFTDEGLTAVLCVSGLHEGKDHELMVRALADDLGIGQVPFVTKALI